MGHKLSNKAKVDAFLADAVGESDPAARSRLIGKAAYWNRVVEKEAAPPLKPGDPWVGYSRARLGR